MSCVADAAASGSSNGGASSVDPATQMNTFRSYVSMLTDPTCKDESKFKAAQALGEDLEVRNSKGCFSY